MVLAALVVYITPINNQLLWFFTGLNAAGVNDSTLHLQLSPSPAYALITICILRFHPGKSMSTLLQWHYFQRSLVFAHWHSSHAPKENWSRHEKKWLKFARRFTCFLDYGRFFAMEHRLCLKSLKDLTQPGVGIQYHIWILWWGWAGWKLWY